MQSKKKQCFEIAMSDKLAKLRTNDPKGFWNLLREGFISNKVGDIEMNEWFRHFSNLLIQDGPNCFGKECAQPYDKEVEDLDKDFTLQELREAIFYHLKFHKASGPDGVPNEFLKWGLEFLQHVLLNLFNQLWKKRVYPASWNELFLVPIFKSGSFKDPNNYRGIALMSCLGKLFAILVNTRLYTWAEKNSKISKWQGGFRRRMGCDTQCFRLMASIMKQFSRSRGYMNKLQGRVFACFVDFKKAYDSVNHVLLWKKLMETGISAKILNLLQQMYKDIKCRVKFRGFVSDEFIYSTGVRQGCVLSPLLFNFFINGIVDIIETTDVGISVGDALIFILLYADDIVLIADNENDLQLMVTRLEAFCEQSQLKVNIPKTKWMVFEQRTSKSTINLNLSFIGESLEKVSFFK